MECISPKYLHERDITVPCGICPFCMATRRSDWSSRIHYERRLHLRSFFVTLTYADSHLIFKNGISQLSVPTRDERGKQVKQSHLQEWFKNVRKKGYKFRYYAVGEYGSHTFRPHYHVLVFGDVPEMVLRKAWNYGMVHIGQVTAGSVSYCLKYMVNGKARAMRNGRVLPYATMSRNPGLGANYLTKAMIEWHKSDRKNYMLVDGQKRHLPRYYKGKIFSKIDHVRIAVREGRASIDSLRAKLMRIGKEAKIVVCKEYPRGALSYYEEQMRRLGQRIRDKTQQNLTI